MTINRSAWYFFGMILVILFILIGGCGGIFFSSELASLDSQLFEAAGAGKLKRVRSLINQGAEINYRFESGPFAGMTPLHIAAAEGHSEITRLLIENEAKVNVSTDTGVRPLHLAAHYGNIKVVRIFLKNGAELEATVKKGQLAGATPLDLARRGEYQGVVEVLRTARASRGNIEKET